MRETNTEVTIEKLVYGGEGLARQDGRVVLTTFVLPGETALVQTVKVTKDVVHARPLRVLAPSSRRVEPGCPYFGRCGGCQYQHADYEYQLEQKLAILREVIRRVGKLEAPENIRTISGPPWEYRNRSQFHIHQNRIGYLEAGSHKLCPVDRCPISSPGVNRGLAALKEMLHDRRFPPFLRTVEIFTNEDRFQVNAVETARPVGKRFFDWCAERLPGADDPYLEYACAGFRFRVSPDSFFQVNRFLADELVSAALEGEQPSTALDLYAGAGLFALPLAKAGARVSAVESGSMSARDLEYNAGRANLEVETICDRVDRFLASLPSAPELVLADPPRTGLGKQAVAEILRLLPPRLVIVACDPATLARDLALLTSRYRIEEMILVDLFPQTAHLETVVKLRVS